MFQFERRFPQINPRQQILDRFRAHLGHESIAVLLARFAVFHFREQLLRLERRLPLVNDHIIFVIQDAFEFARGQVEHQPHPRWHGLEKPDVTDRHGQFDMAHAFPAHPRQGDFYAAAIANDAAVLDPLVLAAITFPVPHRPENPFAEQAAFFWFERPVIDRLRILYFAVRPGPDYIRGCDANTDAIKGLRLFQAKCGACRGRGCRCRGNGCRRGRSCLRGGAHGLLVASALPDPNVEAETLHFLHQHVE